jgi:hypothetical protein
MTKSSKQRRCPFACVELALDFEGGCNACQGDLLDTFVKISEVQPRDVGPHHFPILILMGLGMGVNGRATSSVLVGEWSREAERSSPTTRGDHDSATSPSADHAFNSACGSPIIAYEILARTFEFVAGSGQHERGPVAIRTHRHGKEVR